MSYTVLGGKLVGSVSINIGGQVPVPIETMRLNAKHTGGLGLRTYRDVEPAHCPLAVVGGGHTVSLHVDTLRGWQGHVWAINGAWGWCRDHGIDATFISADPHPIVAQWCAGAKRAILEEMTDPSVFRLLADADVVTFDADGPAGGIVGRGSTATAIPHLACRMRYHGVTFFGCESCYPQGSTHVYQHEARDEEMLVEVDGVPYLTAPDFFVQAIELANLIRELPGYLHEESGGLLRAILHHPEHHIRWMSDGMAAGLTDLKAVAA